MKGFEKYIPFTPQPIENRTWPDKLITKAPAWCSVDLRDGNQALIDPMNMTEKLEMFHMLVDEIGVKEVEIGFPSASDTDYAICRELIEGGHIPDDVTIQVLVQARPHLIKKTFEAIQGAKHVIFHFYNSTSTLQRLVVFRTDVEGVKKIATDAADLIYEMAQPVIASGMDLRYEYSPESFMGTEMDAAVEICAAVLDHLHADAERRVILNLPTTVENCMPNQFADELEYFIRKLPGRERAIISLHPHNDRGCGIATTEMGLLAGAERVEACLFGNGERTGNVDMITLALNMFSQGIDPELDFSRMDRVIDMYQRCTKMRVPERQPYAGDLVFTAFSGSHQDAINKGFNYMDETHTDKWMVPYLPINPSDLGRSYDPVRINSQSGKGGIGYLLEHNFGYNLPPKMREEVGYAVKGVSDREHKELSPLEVLGVFTDNYVNVNEPLELVDYHFVRTPGIKVILTVRINGEEKELTASGNGRLDAVSNALKKHLDIHYSNLTYTEHAISTGSSSKAITYVSITMEDGSVSWGAGIHDDIIAASINALFSAINRKI